MPEWSDEKKAKVIEDYLAANPTPENSMQIVKDIADGLGDDYTPNGVMAILVKAKKYVKKTSTTTTSKSNGEAKGTRVNKADAINNLTDAIEAAGLEADGDIIGKLTGKAALYFTGVIEQLTAED